MSKKFAWILAAIFGPLAIGLFALDYFYGSKTPDKSKPLQVKVDKTYSIKPMELGAVSREDYNAMMQFAAKNDTESISRMILLGKALRTEDTRGVVLACEGFGCSVVKVKPEGRDYTFYTYKEALTN